MKTRAEKRAPCVLRVPRKRASESSSIAVGGVDPTWNGSCKYGATQREREREDQVQRYRQRGPSTALQREREIKYGAAERKRDQVRRYREKERSSTALQREREREDRGIHSGMHDAVFELEQLFCDDVSCMLLLGVTTCCL